MGKPNYNVVLTFCFRISDGLATGIWASSVLSNFISVTMGNDPEANTKVGIAQALQGAFLVATAIPAAWACGRFRRSTLLKFHSMCGFAAIVVLASALTLFVHASADSLFQVLCLGLSLMGMAQASAPIVDSLFADSIPTGKRAGLYTGLTVSYVLSSAVGPATAAVLFVLHGDVWSTERMSRVMLMGLALACIPASLLLMFDDTRVLGQEAEGLLKVLGTEEREQYAREEDEEGGLREPLLQNGTDAEERGGGGDWRSDDLEGFESRLVTPADSRVNSRSITPSKSPGIPAANSPFGAHPSQAPSTPTRSLHGQSPFPHHYQQQQQQRDLPMPPTPPQPPAPAPPPSTPPHKVQRVKSRRRKTEEELHHHQGPHSELEASPSGQGSSLPADASAHSPSPLSGRLFQRSASARHASFGAADRAGREHGQRHSGVARQVVFGAISHQGSPISSRQASFTSRRHTSSEEQHSRHEHEQREHDSHRGGSSRRDMQRLSSFAVPIEGRSSDEDTTASASSPVDRTPSGRGMFESKPHAAGAQRGSALQAEAEVKDGQAAQSGEAGTDAGTTERREPGAGEPAAEGQASQGKSVAGESEARGGEGVINGCSQGAAAAEGERPAATVEGTGAEDAAGAVSTSGVQGGGAAAEPDTLQDPAATSAAAGRPSHAATAVADLAAPAATAAAAAASPTPAPAVVAGPAERPAADAATPAEPAAARAAPIALPVAAPGYSGASVPGEVPELSREVQKAEAASKAAAAAAAAEPAGPIASGEVQNQRGQLAGAVPAAAAAAATAAAPALSTAAAPTAQAPATTAAAPALSTAAASTAQAPATAAAHASQLAPALAPAARPPSAAHSVSQAAAEAAAAAPAFPPTERLKAPAPVAQKSMFDSSASSSTSSTSSSTSSSTLEAITQLARAAAPSSSSVEATAHTSKPAHPSSSLLEAVSQTAKATAAAQPLAAAAAPSLAAGAVAPVAQLTARAASAAPIPSAAATAPAAQAAAAAAASFPPSSARPPSSASAAAARAAAAASALGAWSSKASGDLGRRTSVVINRKPSDTLPDPHLKAVPGTVGASEVEHRRQQQQQQQQQQEQQQEQQQQKGASAAAAAEGPLQASGPTSSTHEISTSHDISTGVDTRGGQEQPACEQAGGTQAPHHAVTVPAGPAYEGGQVRDASQGEGGSGQPQLPQDALLPAREPVLGCLTPAAIPYILAMTDCCMGLASGMTIKFFPIFFRTEAKLSPSNVSLMYTAIPLALSSMALVAQREAHFIGRVQTIVTNRLIGITLLLFIATHTGLWTVPAAIVPLYICRTSIMNAQYPIQRSILMDYVPKATRARWASVESVTQFGWSGSAAVGGFLIERYGFQTTFFVTASMQLVGWLCSLLLLPLVPRKAVSVVAAQEQQQGR